MTWDWPPMHIWQDYLAPPLVQEGRHQLVFVDSSNHEHRLVGAVVAHADRFQHDQFHAYRHWEVTTDGQDLASSAIVVGMLQGRCWPSRHCVRRLHC